MVDPIEVKIDAIEDTTLKTWGDVQRLMRDFSRPETRKEMIGQLPGGTAGGIFDAAINKLTRALPGGQAMAAGMAGGMAAGGVMALVQIIGEAISSSRVLMTLLKLISGALGLLINVILLPFLPVLIMGILWLYRGIMLFHQLWSKIWSSNVMQGIKLGLERLANALAPGLSAMLNFAFAPVGAAGSVAWSILTWLWDIFTKKKGILSTVLSFGLGPLGWLVKWLYNIATGKEPLDLIPLDFSLGAIGDLLVWLRDATLYGISVSLNFVNDAASKVAETASTAGDWLSGFLSGGWLPSFAGGGTVPGRGPVPIMAHGGERVLPAGDSGGTKIFNFYGYDDNKLKTQVENILRKEQYRYNV